MNKGKPIYLNMRCNLIIQFRTQVMLSDFLHFLFSFEEIYKIYTNKNKIMHGT